MTQTIVDLENTVRDAETNQRTAAGLLAQVRLENANLRDQVTDQQLELADKATLQDQVTSLQLELAESHDAALKMQGEAKIQIEGQAASLVDAGIQAQRQGCVTRELQQTLAECQAQVGGADLMDGWWDGPDCLCSADNEGSINSHLMRHAWRCGSGSTNERLP